MLIGQQEILFFCHDNWLNIFHNKVQLMISTAISGNVMDCVGWPNDSKWVLYNKRAQVSYRFLDLKFKTFPRLFSKTIISFSKLKVIKFICRWSIKTLKNQGTKIFWWCAANIQVRLSKTWPKRKRLFTNFSRLFPGLENC